MEFQDIMDYIILYLPVILAVLSEITVVATVISKVRGYFESTKQAVDTLKESTEYTALKNQMQVVLDENTKLKKQMNVLMETITRVKVNDNESKN